MTQPGSLADSTKGDSRSPGAGDTEEAHDTATEKESLAAYEGV